MDCTACQTGSRENPLDETVLKEATADMAVLKDYINKLPEIRFECMGNFDRMGPFFGERLRLKLYMETGSELRFIRQLLETVDKNRRWGGLTRVVTPEGHILWLCKEHAKEYK